MCRASEIREVVSSDRLELEALREAMRRRDLVWREREHELYAEIAGLRDQIALLHRLNERLREDVAAVQQ